MKERLMRFPKLVYFGVYFGVVSLLRWRFNWDALWLVVGGLLGMYFSYVDRVIHIYWTRPNEQLSFQIKSLIKQNRYKEAVYLLKERRSEQRFLASKSVLFMAAWVPLAFL